MRLSIAACVTALVLFATAAAAPDAQGAPAVTAALNGDTLVLSFPATTMPKTVSFVAHGIGVTQTAIQRKRRAFQWSSDTELSVDLNRFHHAHQGAWKVAEIWVWGQLASGEALLQKVVVNP
jgi:hypothetical protein